MQRKTAKILSMAFILMFILAVAGCGGSSKSAPIDPTVTSTISGLVTGVTGGTGAPIRLGPNRVQMKAGEFSGKKAIIAYYNNQGELIPITGINPVNLDGDKGSYNFTDVVIPESLRKNLIVKIYDETDKDFFMANVIPYVKSGTTTAETITPSTSNKALIVKAAAKQNKTSEINIAEILAKIPPSTLAKLNASDVEVITNAFIVVIANEKSLATRLGFTTAQYTSLNDMAFQLSQEIMEGIENGKYPEEDKAWKIYEYKLRAWALENGYEESSVDSMLKAKKNEINKVATDISSGNITINGKLVTFEEATKVKNAFNTMVNDNKIGSSLDLMVNEILRFKNRMVNAKNAFKLTTLDLSKLQNKIDEFVLTIRSKNFSTPEEAEQYMEIASKELEKLASIKLGEFILIGITDETKRNTFISKIESDVFVKINEGMDTLLASKTTYNLIFSYADFGNEGYADLLDIVENYMEFAEGELQTKADNVKKLLDDFASLFKTAFNLVNTSQQLGWTPEQCNTMGELFVSMMVLDIEKPLPMMNVAGEGFGTWGRLKELSTPHTDTEYPNESFPYEIVEPLTGARIAYARVYTPDDQVNLWEMIDSEAKINYWNENIQNEDSINKTGFDAQNSSGLWFYKIHDDGVWAKKVAIERHGLPSISLNEYSLKTNVVDKEFEMDGFIRPPSAVLLNGAIDINNISKFETEPLIFVIGNVYQGGDFNFDKFIGQPMDINAKVIFDNDTRTWMVVHCSAEFNEINNKWELKNNLNTVITNKLIAPVMDINTFGVSTKPEFWNLDFNTTKTWNQTTNQEEFWNPNTIDNISDKIYNLKGNVILKEDKSDGKYMTFQVHFIEEPFTFNNGFEITNLTVAGVINVENNQAVEKVY
ncbi:MAG: hypothetical protein M0R46_16905 [Candidatus Muirbacterium halophilum]|nr:hypothetical protein [Candidatus Muirbacterium halophilum]MCK9477597.1 hypothetical protein [Candidatus Muirbacterium halophilum]